MVSNSTAMTRDRYPVILVHGWNSHPGIWKGLVVRLEAAGIPYRKFDHTGMKGASLPEIAESSKVFSRMFGRKTPGPDLSILCAIRLGPVLSDTSLRLWMGQNENKQSDS